MIKNLQITYGHRSPILSAYLLTCNLIEVFMYKIRKLSSVGRAAAYKAACHWFNSSSFLFLCFIFNSTIYNSLDINNNGVIIVKLAVIRTRILLLLILLVYCLFVIYDPFQGWFFFCQAPTNKK